MSQSLLMPDVAMAQVANALGEVRRFGRWEAYVSCADQHLLVVPSDTGGGFTIEVGGRGGVRAGWWPSRAEAATVCRELTAGFRLLAVAEQERGP